MGKRLTDREHADNFEKFYGIQEGWEPVVPRGTLPKQEIPEDADDLTKAVITRLNYLRKQTHPTSAGPLQLKALRAAKIPMILHDNKWKIDIKAIGRASDWENAQHVRDFYGLLDKSTAIGTLGEVPSRHSPEGASEFERTMRAFLNNICYSRSGRNTAGPEVAAALREAKLEVRKVEGKENAFVIIRPVKASIAGSSQAVAAAPPPLEAADQAEALPEYAMHTQESQHPGTSDNYADWNPESLDWDAGGLDWDAGGSNWDAEGIDWDAEGIDWNLDNFEGGQALADAAAPVFPGSSFDHVPTYPLQESFPSAVNMNSGSMDWQPAYPAADPYLPQPYLSPDVSHPDTAVGEVPHEMNPAPLTDFTMLDTNPISYTDTQPADSQTDFYSGAGHPQNPVSSYLSHTYVPYEAMNAAPRPRTPVQLPQQYGQPSKRGRSRA